MNPCTHWKDIQHHHGGFCTLHGMTCSLGVCRSCKFNTSTTWPPDKLPGNRSLATARPMDCKKARHQQATRKA